MSKNFFSKKPFSRRYLFSLNSEDDYIDTPTLTIKKVQLAKHVEK